MNDPHDLLVRTFGRGGGLTRVEAPGRVNIIGEHTDYNDGLALPFATQMITSVVLRRTPMRVLRVVSETIGDPAELPLPLTVPRPGNSKWYDHVAGLLWSFRSHLPRTSGLDVAISSTVPIARGMSSSAALEIALGTGLRQLFSLGMDDIELVQHCQRADIEYVGINCGVMDQYASLMAQAGKALFLDVRAMKHRHVSAAMNDMSWVVIDSDVRRQLALSGYNTRRDECREALSIIQTIPGFDSAHSLRDVEICDLSRLEPNLPAVLFKRLRHVVEENERVRRMVDALQSDDSAEVGRLLTESHISLRDLYQVSIPEIDFLVEASLELGAVGARIMGGGFGGVTLQLVPTEHLEELRSKVMLAYKREFGLTALAIPVIPSAGAKQRAEGRGK